MICPRCAIWTRTPRVPTKPRQTAKRADHAEAGPARSCSAAVSPIAVELVVSAVMACSPCTVAVGCDRLPIEAHRREGVRSPPSPDRRARVRLDRTIVAHVGTGRASAVRADCRRTVSGDVRRDSRIWLSYADSVGLCQVGSGYRLGLQVGGRGFESRTLQHRWRSDPLPRGASTPHDA